MKAQPRSGWLQLLGLLLAPDVVAATIPTFYIGQCTSLTGHMPAFVYLQLKAFKDGFFDDMLPQDAGSAQFDVEISELQADCDLERVAQLGPRVLKGFGKVSGRVYDDDDPSNDRPPVTVFLGCHCDDTTTLLSQLSAAIQTPLIGPYSSEDLLSDKMKHPYFVRTCPAAVSEQHVLAEMIISLSSKAPLQGWKFITLIQRLGSVPPAAALDRIKEAIPTLAVSVVELPMGNPIANGLDLDFDFDTLLPLMDGIKEQRPKPRIFIWSMNELTAAKMFYQAGLMGEKTLFFLPPTLCTPTVFDVHKNLIADLAPDALPADHYFQSTDAWSWSNYAPHFRGHLCPVAESSSKAWYNPEVPDLRAQRDALIMEVSVAEKAFQDAQAQAKIVEDDPASTTEQIEAATQNLVALELALTNKQIALGEAEENLVKGSNTNKAFSDIYQSFSWTQAVNMGLVPWQGMVADEDVWLDHLAYDDQPLFRYQWDAFHAAIMGIATLVKQGVSAENIRGLVLLNAIKSSDFTGLSGGVKFQETGDRVIKYLIKNIEVADGGGRRLSSADFAFVTVGEYSTDGEAVTWSSTKEVRYADGGREVPADRPVPCDAGSQSVGDLCEICGVGKFGTKLGEETYCIDCQAGYYTSAPGMVGCTAAPLGAYVPEPGRSNFTICAVGTSAAEMGQVACDACAAGTSVNEQGQSSCILCDQGQYQPSTGQTACLECQDLLDGGTTTSLGSDAASLCVCPRLFYRPRSANFCKLCPRGMTCEEGSDMRLMGNVSQTGEYPRLRPGYWSPKDDPLSVFECKEPLKCPGGDPGTCGANLQREISCEHCKSGLRWNGETCQECPGAELVGLVFPMVPLAILLLLPLCLFLVSSKDTDTWDGLRNVPPVLLLILLNNYQIITLVSETAVFLDERLDGMYEKWRWTNDPMRLFRVACVGVTGMTSQMLIKAAVPLVLAGCFALNYFGIKTAMTMTDQGELIEEMSVKKDHFFNLFASVLFMFFGTVVAMATDLFKCKLNPNKLLTLQSDSSVICYESSEWQSMVGVSVVCILLYIVSPSFLILRSILQARTMFDQADFRSRWKFMYIKYHAAAWWWGLVFFAKIFLVNFALMVSAVPMYQLLMIQVVVLVYTSFAGVIYPYRFDWANKLEMIVGFSVIINTALVTGFAVKNDPYEREDTLRLVAFVTTYIPVAAGVGIVLWLANVHKGPSNEKWEAKFQEQRDKALERFVETSQMFVQVPSEELVAFSKEIGDNEYWLLNEAGNTIMAELGEKMQGRVSARSSQVRGSTIEGRISTMRSSTMRSSQARGSMFVDPDEIEASGAEKIHSTLSSGSEDMNNVSSTTANNPTFIMKEEETVGNEVTV